MVDVLREQRQFLQLPSLVLIASGDAAHNKGLRHYILVRIAKAILKPSVPVTPMTSTVVFPAIGFSTA